MKICHREKQEREYGLETLKVSAKQLSKTGNCCMLQVTGACTGAVSQTLLLVFQVYNDDGEMIGADFSQVLLPDTGREHAFETLINLPCQEAVSLIAVQVIPDPGTWMMSDVVSKLHELQVQPLSDDAAGAEHSQSRPQSLKEFAEDWENRWAEWEWMDDHDR